MAIELFQGRVEQIHHNLINNPVAPLRFVTLAELKPYWGTGDYYKFIYDHEQYDRNMEREQTLALLILAAEEELDGYPMTAVEVEQ